MQFAPRPVRYPGRLARSVYHESRREYYGNARCQAVSDDKTPLDHFKDFVSKVLTVTKEDVQKMETEIESYCAFRI